MSPFVPVNCAEGDKGDKRGTCPAMSRPVGGQDRTKPLGLSYVPLAVRGWWGRNEEDKERLCGTRARNEAHDHRQRLQCVERARSSNFD